jgi:hypothetical protein
MQKEQAAKSGNSLSISTISESLNSVEQIESKDLNFEAPPRLVNPRDLEINSFSSEILKPIASLPESTSKQIEIPKAITAKRKINDVLINDGAFSRRIKKSDVRSAD